MFWKGKSLKQLPKDESEADNTPVIHAHTTRVLKRETVHAKAVIDGKLYDTEKAEIISPTIDRRVLFMTKKGNYFSCDTRNDNYVTRGENEIYDVSEIVYSDIRPESLEHAMSNIGKYEPEKYIELFGEVEEA